MRVPLQSTAYAVPPGTGSGAVSSVLADGVAVPESRHGDCRLRTADQAVASAARPSGSIGGCRRLERETGTALASEKTMQREGARRVHRNLHNGELEVEFDWHGSRDRILATDTEMGEENVTRYRILEGDPLSATVVCEVEVTLSRPGWGQTRTRASSTMTCDAEQFTVTSAIDAFHDGVRIHARSTRSNLRWA